ncbi:hypothetical protein A9X03_15395 [Mycobacterium sp. E1715]|nr:hypothetical protein A9X03_15395 [Mycobacterium sp. E1715]
MRLRLAGIKQFAKWLAAEEGFDADPIAAIKPPKLKQDDVPDLSVNELQRMLKVCDGPSFRDKRDKAILMMLADTGARASELLALNITDVDLDECMAHIHGKGGKSRRARFSHGTAAALDRYVRARRSRVTRPTSGPLWLSVRGQRLSYTGLRTTLQERASDAGVVAFHAHRLRHTMSVRWLRSGGSETGLRAHAGWSSNTMITRYVKAASEQLAAEEFDRLNLGLTEL